VEQHAGHSRLIGLLLGVNLITEGMALAGLVWTAKKAD
jgi:uncharacterized membrane protein HdeD (DUF308 family)